MLTHVDSNNRPTMVDVTAKAITTRVARAQSQIQLTPEMAPFFQGSELVLKKGPVFHTAIIAGTMAAKRTHELIPFCHPLPVESCKLKITMDADLLVTVTCEVKTTGRTGVEMEALHGASVAALTIYDMCKAVSHEMIIKETKLLGKTGGKRPLLDRPVFGLVLTGGKSERMKQDKALLDYKGQPHAAYLREVLMPYCQEVYLSARPEQWSGTSIANLPTINDCVEGSGPIAGILSAFEKHPDAYWFVAACDLPYFNEAAVEEIFQQHPLDGVATGFKNQEKDFAEPLCTLYAPEARGVFQSAWQQGITCPVKVLRQTNGVTKLLQQGLVNLANVNTPEELAEVHHEIH